MKIVRRDIVRKFEIVCDYKLKYGLKAEDIILPKRSTKHSAGYDLYCPIDVTIPAGKIETIWTNVKAQCEDDECYLVIIRSSMGRKDICLANDVGLIDSDYYSNPDNDGNIGVALKNRNETDFVINKGDRIAQVVFIKYLKTDDDVESECERTSGFGHTNK